MAFKIYHLEDKDIDIHLKDLYALNQANTPAVGSIESVKLFKSLLLLANINLLIKQNNTLVGFLVSMRDNSTYTSLNYQYFAAKYKKFIYIDRIAIRSDKRQKGAGKALYEALYSLSSDIVCCEVNTIPKNQASIDFHKSMGFLEEGNQDFDDGHSVVYLTKSSD